LRVGRGSPLVGFIRRRSWSVTRARYHTCGAA